MATMLYKLGRTAFRRRKATLAVWLVLLGGMFAAAATLSGPTTDAATMPGTESQRAIDLLEQRLPEANGASGRIVFAAPEGERLTGGERATAVADAAAAAAKAPGVDSVSEPLTSEDGRVALAQVNWATPADDLPEGSVEAVQAAAETARDAGVQVEFGGDAVTSEASLGGVGEIIGFAVAALVLLITFGSLDGRRAAAADGADRRRDRDHGDHGGHRLRRHGLGGPDGRADARPRRRHRLRAVHHLAPPRAAVRGHGPRGVRGPRRRHRRQRGRLRRRDRGDRSGLAGRRRDPVHDRDGPGRRGHGRRRRGRLAHARPRAARVRRPADGEGQELRDRPARGQADARRALGRPAHASPRARRGAVGPRAGRAVDPRAGHAPRPAGRLDRRAAGDQPQGLRPARRRLRPGLQRPAHDRGRRGRGREREGRGRRRRVGVRAARGRRRRRHAGPQRRRATPRSSRSRRAAARRRTRRRTSSSRSATAPTRSTASSARPSS